MLIQNVLQKSAKIILQLEAFTSCWLHEDILEVDALLIKNYKEAQLFRPYQDITVLKKTDYTAAGALLPVSPASTSAIF